MGFLSLLLFTPMLLAFGMLAIFLLAAPCCVGILLQLILTVIGQQYWVKCVPAGLGALGLAGSLFFLRELVPVPGILIYWGIYFLLLWLVWLVVTQIKLFVLHKITK